MPDLQMSLIGSPADVVNPLFAGEIKPEGIELVATRADGSTGYWRQFSFDEFDVSSLSVAQVHVAILRPGDQDGVDLLPEPRRVQGEVDEPRGRDLHPRHLLALRDQGDQALGDLHGVHGQGPRQLQGQAAGVVAMLRVLGPLHHRIGQWRGCQEAQALGLLEGLYHASGYRLLDGHGASMRKSRRLPL